MLLLVLKFEYHGHWLFDSLQLQQGLQSVLPVLNPELALNPEP